ENKKLKIYTKKKKMVKNNNENKLYNRVENLEWCNGVYNATYDKMEEVNKKKRKLVKFTSLSCNVSFVLDYNEDYENLGFSKRGAVVAISKGKNYRGYKIEYIERQ